MDIEDSLDTTQELLDDTLPSTPDVVDSVIQDDSEEEIFFGNVSSKEKNGKNATFNRRCTIGMSESDRRRSFEKSKPIYKMKSKDVFSLRDSLDSRTSLYGSEKSITEEDGLDEVFTMDEKKTAIENEASPQPQAITENLPSLNLGNGMDEETCLEDQEEINEIHQSFEQEGLRHNSQEDASNFLVGHSFNIQDNSDKTDDDIGSKNMLENNTIAVVDNSLHLSLPPSMASNSFSSEAACDQTDHDFPQPVSIDDTFSTADPPIDVFSNEITGRDDLPTLIIHERLSLTDALQTLSTEGFQPLISESVCNDEKSPINCSSSCNDGLLSTKMMHSQDDLSNNLARPALLDDNFSSEVTPPRYDVQDSFFSNAASCSISGIESLDSTSQLERSRSWDLNDPGSPSESVEGDNLLNIEMEDASSTFTSPSHLMHVQSPPIVENILAETASILKNISGHSLLVPGDEGNFLSIATEWHQRDITEPDVASKIKFSLPSPNTIAQELSPVSRERMYSLMEDSTISSSCDDSEFSNNCLESNVEDTVSDSFLNLKKLDDTNERTNDIMDVEMLDNKTKSLDEVGNFSLNKEDNELEAESLDQNDSMGEISVQKKVTIKIIEATNYDNDDEDLFEDILDVGNDQLFDDSLYSMEDNTSRRLSTIGNKICHTWKNKEKKTKKSCDKGAFNHLVSVTEASENVDAMQEICQENVDVTHDSFYSVLESLPNSRDVSFCGETEDFDNTADEMVLYEMFGADYDEIVEKMSAGEKNKLRKKLDARTTEDQQQTGENLKIQLSELDVSISPSPLTKTNNSQVETCISTSPVAMAHASLLDKNSSTKSHNPDPIILVEKDCFRTPVSPARSSSTEPQFKSPTYLQQTASSLHKRVTPSPSQSKHIPWRPVSPHGKSFIPTPVRTGSLVRTPLITTPQLSGGLVRTPGSGSLVRAPLLTTPQLSGGLVRTPGSSSKAKVPTSRSAYVDLNHHAIVSPSPLGTYLRDNKPPPLVHQVKAQSAVRDLESTLMEVENCENEAPVEACPLPEATYYAPNLSKENITDATKNDYKIPEAYGQTNTLAKVTRHVGRMKVAGKIPGIHWGEDLATDQSLNSSPSHAQLGPAGKSVLKKTQRDSGTFDESMVDLSVLETVTIKKIGRGTNKKKGK